MKKIYNLFLLITSVVIAVFSLVLFLTTFNFDKEEWGTEVGFDEKYTIVLIGALALLFYSIYKFVKGDNAKVLYFNILMIVESALLGFYPLGIFFKTLTKAIEANKDFSYKDNQFYLYLGIIGLFVFATFIIKYFLDRKEKGESLDNN